MSALNFELIRSFSILAECCHFGEAARRLNISQPALSKHINRLEDILGAKLFRRDRQGTRLTALGTTFLADVRPMLLHADRMWENGMRAARGEHGKLSLGFTFSSLEVMSKVLFRFKTRFPEIEIVFSDKSSRHQIEEVKSGNLDAGFVRLPASDGLAVIRVARDRLSLICPTDLMESISGFDDPAVRSLPFIALKPEVAPGIEEYIQRLFRSRGFQPKTLHRVNETMTILRLVAAGFGVVLMHEFAIRSEQGSIAGLSFYPVDDAIAEWDVGLIWRTDDRNPLLRHFLEAVTEEMQS